MAGAPQASGAGDAARPTRVAIVLKGYPRLSETFIAQEILALKRRGMDLTLVSLRHPTDPAVHPIHREIDETPVYLPEYLYRAPAAVFGAWRRRRRAPGYSAAQRAWLRDLRRDPTPNRGRRFGQALVLADLIARDPRLAGVDWFYAHFIHSPASVARYASLLTGLPWSVSAHAKDIWTSPDWDLREKLGSARWCVACTQSGCARLEALGGVGAAILAYHGIDLKRFPPPGPGPGNGGGAGRDGADPIDPVRLLSVGRAVAKKGYDDLLTALAGLPRTVAWQLTHIGDGAESGVLRARAGALGLSDRIEWRGAQPQDVVLSAYRAADLFVLASRIGADGDRDGLPNVLMEAASQGLCILATDLSGIPELVSDGETGMLVPPADPSALRDALAALIANPSARKAKGAEGERRVRALFDMRAGIAILAELFGLNGLGAATDAAARRGE